MSTCLLFKALSFRCIFIILMSHITCDEKLRHIFLYSLKSPSYCLRKPAHSVSTTIGDEGSLHKKSTIQKYGGAITSGQSEDSTIV